MRQVSEVVAEVLATDPDGLNVRQLMSRLRAAGHQRVPRSLVERTLAGDRRFASDGDGLRATWTVVPVEDDGPVPAPVDQGRPLDGLALRDWQIEAFAAWAANGSRGVVEAVTGTGKTRLAVAAVRACLAHAGQGLVLVPTLELQQQWVRELRALVPGARIGRLGGGHVDDLGEHHVVVATPHSAASVPIEPDGPGLLVADEAHRYGSPTWGAALKPAFRMRLALTATYERNDEGVEDVLGPYFGGVVCRYGYDRAVPDGVVARFRIGLVATDLEAGERGQYDRLDGQVRQLHAELTGELGMPRDPRRLFPKLVALAAEAPSRSADRRSAAARAYLAAVRARRDVAANAAGKLDVVAKAGPGIAASADRTLVFCDTVEQAEHAAIILSRAGVAAETVHGDLPDTKRRIRMAQFRNGNLGALVAPRVLDEGVDVPEADVALVLAAFQTRRQMIQRLGRVLRLKPDGRPARLLVAYARDTREDPARGGHDEFLREVRGVADEVRDLDADRDPDGIGAFLDLQAPRSRPPSRARPGLPRGGR